MRYNPNELKNRILRSLGSGFNKVLLTNHQIYQCIDDALLLYTQYHFDGIDRDFILIRVGDDEAGRTGIIQLGSHVKGISRIIQYGTGFALEGVATTDGATDTWFQSLFQSVLGLGSGTCSFGLSGLSSLGFWTVSDTNMQMWRNKINPTPDYSYNANNNVLMIADKNIKEGTIIAVEAFVASSVGMYEGGLGSVVGGMSASSNDSLIPSVSDTYHDPHAGSMYAGGGQMSQGALGDRWVIEYATALAKLQWGENLRGVEDMSLPGGVKMSGREMREEATIKINRLRAEIEGFGEHPAIIMG